MIYYISSYKYLVTKKEGEKMETNNFEYDDLVKNIRNIISAKGFKQGAIAKKANFTDSEFSNMLNDRRKLIRAEYLPQIAHALDVDVNELFRK